MKNHSHTFLLGDIVIIDKIKSNYNDNDTPRKIIDFLFRPYEGYFAILEGLSVNVHVESLTKIF